MPHSRSQTARLFAAAMGVILIASSACAPAAAPAGSETMPPPSVSPPGPAEVTPSPSSPAAPSPTSARHVLADPPNPAQVSIKGTSFFGWALIDRRTGAETGSANARTATNTVESMIKPWLAADYLRQKGVQGQQPTERTLAELTLMIIDSNDPLAEKYYQLGGSDALIRRLTSVCGLSRVEITPEKWSFTTMTVHDAAAYGLCLADGSAAGPYWTTWILDTMKNVRGGVGGQVSGDVQGGRWGIIDALPPDVAGQTSIKNGWTSYKDGWHVNCLAINPDWVLAIMLRRGGSLPAAAAVCTDVTAQLVGAA